MSTKCWAIDNSIFTEIRSHYDILEVDQKFSIVQKDYFLTINEYFYYSTYCPKLNNQDEKLIHFLTSLTKNDT